MKKLTTFDAGVLMECNELDLTVVGEDLAHFLQDWVARVRRESVAGADPASWQQKAGGDWAAVFMGQG